MELADMASFWPVVWRWALLVAPFGLGYWAWDRWVHYVQELYILNLKFTMLEIRTPQNIDRSPEAMELLLNGLCQTGGTGTWEKMFWMGRVRTWFSLELVSIEGTIYFFIRCESKFAEFFKSQVYAFYPEAEVSEVDDYTKYVPNIPKDPSWDLWGTEFKLLKPDAYPIKTYKDYQLEKQVGMDDNQKFDPLSSNLSWMSSLKPGEQMWLQILARASVSGRHAVHGDRFKKQDWRSANADVVHDFTKKVQQGMVSSKDKAAGKKFDDLYPEAAKRRVTSYLSTVEKETFDAIQRKATKNTLDVGIRAIYLAKKDSFVGAQDIFVNGFFRLFGSDHLNTIIPENAVDQDYKWESPFGSFEKWKKEQIFKAYIHRSYFYPPHDKTLDSNLHKIYRPQMILNVEELATIFHLPGKEVSSPTIARVEAKKSEPPANLPV